MGHGTNSLVGQMVPRPDSLVGQTVLGAITAMMGNSFKQNLPSVELPTDLPMELEMSLDVGPIWKSRQCISL